LELNRGQRLRRELGEDQIHRPVGESLYLARLANASDNPA
jgi:hypothetical protein